MGKTEINPTERNYDAWRQAYDRFNVELFGNRLRGCLITLQRHRNSYGFYAGSRFEETDGGTKADEIALNPRHFSNRPPSGVLATLVHEMAHQYEWHFGKPSRDGYHNKSWARLMIDIGLVPSDTGRPGGKVTGRRVHHFIRAAGPFDRACNELLSSGFVIPYSESNSEADSAMLRKAEELRRQKAASKTRYTCPHCYPLMCMWAKPGFHALCGECGARFQADPSDENWLVSSEAENV